MRKRESEARTKRGYHRIYQTFVTKCHKIARCDHHPRLDHILRVEIDLAIRSTTSLRATRGTTCSALRVTLTNRR